jgi:hypothetical protein
MSLGHRAALFGASRDGFFGRLQGPHTTLIEGSRIHEDDPPMYELNRSAISSAQGNSRTRSSAQPEPLLSAALIRDLEELRASLLRRLDSMEGLARRRPAQSSADMARLEQSLKQRIDELESERGQLRADLEREESHWKQLVAQLESDRRLLAEAWERLERERIESGSLRTAAATHPSRSNDHAAPQPPPTPRPTLLSDSSTNPVAETILRQFQTLCNDVRRTSESRSSTR